jgi:hypothetical protein
MAVNLSPYGGVGAQFLDNSGNVLTGGKIFTYAAGTTTPQTTYTTSAGNIPHSNPIILDASGRVPSGGEIWLTDGLSYKFILRDSNDVLIATYDNLVGINSNFVNFTNQQEIQTATAGQTVFTLTTTNYSPGTNSLSVFVDGVNQYGSGAQYAYIETNSTTVTFVSGLHVGAEVKFTTSQLNSSGLADASQVSYIPAGTGAVPTNVQTKLRQYVSVKDFGAVGDGTTDDTNAVVAASAANVGDDVFFPAGTYLLSADVTFACNVIMDSGAQIVSSDATVFNAGFEAPLEYCLDVSGFTQFLNIVEIYPQWFGAMGDAVYASGTITSGTSTLTVTSPSGFTGGINGFTNGDTIIIHGAGVAGANLSTTVVSGGGTGTITLANTASTTITNPTAIASRDNTVALQRFFNSVQAGGNTSNYGANQPSTGGCTKLYMPTGTYCAFNQIDMYSVCVLEGEFANTVGGTRLVQCNITEPLLNVIADNFDSTGATINGGNGNNIFRNIGFCSAEFNDTATNSPIIYFQHAWNNVSDTEFDHCLWQSTAGACVGGGFETTGNMTSGSTTLTIASGGDTFRNGDVGGGRVIVLGAGVAGANLSTYIVSGAGTNTLILATAASTTVTSAVVVPTKDAFGLKMNDCEMDVCRAGFDFVGNTSGSLIINNLLAYLVVRGAIRVFSIGTWDIWVNDSNFIGNGNTHNGTNVTWRNSIIVQSQGTTAGTLFIDSCQFNHFDVYGGSIIFLGNEFRLTNCELNDLDSANFGKFVAVEAKNVAIQNNSFITKTLLSYATSRIISLGSNSINAVNISGNNFVNTNASSVTNWVEASFPNANGIFIENSFYGNVTSVFNNNIAFGVRNTTVPNIGYGPAISTSSAAPASATNAWVIGDIVYNNAPTSGGYVGWVCTASGSPGTWNTFGLIS